jgi:hypothetical protein
MLEDPDRPVKVVRGRPEGLVILAYSPVSDRPEVRSPEVHATEAGIRQPDFFVSFFSQNDQKPRIYIQSPTYSRYSATPRGLR